MRARGLWIGATLLGAAGCAQLLGLDDTRATADAGGADALVSTSGMALALVDTRITTRVDDVALSLDPGPEFLVVDPAEAGGVRVVPGVADGPGQWTAAVGSGERAMVRWTTPSNTYPNLLDVDGRELSERAIRLGRDGDPAGPLAALDASINLGAPYAGEILTLSTVGAWASRNYPAAERPATGATTFNPPAVLMRDLSPTQGGPVQRVTSADAVFVLRAVGADHNALTGVYTAAPFEQGNDARMLTGTMQVVARDQTLRATLQPTVPAVRFAAAQPANPTVTMSWSVLAAPGHQLGTNSGPRLISASVTSASPADVTVPYGNPFVARDWQPLFTWSAVAARTYQGPGMTAAVGLRAQLFQITRAPSAGELYDLPAPLPVLISVAGVALAADGGTIPLDLGRLVEVGAEFGAGAVDVYALALYEVGDGGGRQQLAFVTASGPTFQLPPALFTVGRRYVLRAAANRGGYPNAASGDLRTRNLPIAVGLLDSGVFTVAAP